jgi:RNA 3'-terminal phosphate cyclase
MHTKTNIEVIKQFLDINIQAVQEEEGRWRIKVSR